MITMLWEVTKQITIIESHTVKAKSLCYLTYFSGFSFYFLPFDEYSPVDCHFCARPNCLLRAPNISMRRENSGHCVFNM